MGICGSSQNKNKEENRVAKVSEMKNDYEKTIMDCKITRDKIKSYIKKLERNEVTKKEKAKEALRGKNKEKAKLLLKQAKMYREQSHGSLSQLNMLEEQIVVIETAKQQSEALKVLQNGNKILKKLNEEVNIEKWEKVTEDLNELKIQQEEIGEFFKNRGIEENVYEDEVEKELEELMKRENIEIEAALPEARKSIVIESKNEKINQNKQVAPVLVEN
jgi:charged multivesicular body protein 6